MGNALNRVRDYFDAIADVLSEEKSVSRVFPNTSDTGSLRENILVDFLSNHLPKRCEVIRGGFIFDSEGSESQQIDIIITNDATLQFKQGTKSFNCIDGCYGAISVKTSLDKSTLTEAILNLSSIPTMPELDEEFSPFLGSQQRDEYRKLPFKVIVAFDGIKSSLLTKHIQDLQRDKKLLLKDLPDLIIVNKRYYVALPRMFSSGFSINSRGKLVEGHAHIGGFALLYMLTRFQYIANFSSLVTLNFREYHDAINRTILGDGN